MLEIKPLSVVTIANMFSHTVGFLVVLLMVSFAVKKAFYFDVVAFVYFLFSFHCPRGSLSEEVLLAYV